MDGAVSTAIPLTIGGELRAGKRLGAGVFGRVYTLSDDLAVKVLKSGMSRKFPMPELFPYWQELADGDKMLTLPDEGELDEWVLQRELDINRRLYAFRDTLQRAAGVSVAHPYGITQVIVPKPYTAGLFSERRSGLVLERLRGTTGWRELWSLPGDTCGKLYERLNTATRLCRQADLQSGEDATQLHRNAIYDREQDMLYMIDFGSWYWSHEESKVNPPQENWPTYKASQRTA